MGIGRLLLFLLVLTSAGGFRPGQAARSGPRAERPSTSQVTSLCDYLAATQGGYGRSVTCPAGDRQTTDDSQSACVSSAARTAQPPSRRVGTGV